MIGMLAMFSLDGKCEEGLDGEIISLGLWLSFKRHLKKSFCHRKCIQSLS